MVVSNSNYQSRLVRSSVSRSPHGRCDAPMAPATEDSRGRRRLTGLGCLPHRHRVRAADAERVKRLIAVLASLVVVASLAACTSSRTGSLLGGTRFVVRPEHRLRAHRRPVDEPHQPHAERARTATFRHDDGELRRGRLAVLPVAVGDLHRRVPARRRRVHQLRIRRRLHRLQQQRQPGQVVRAEPAEARLHDRIHGQVPQRLPAHRPGAAGLERLGRRRQRLPRVQLHAERERHPARIRPRPERLPRRRAAQKAGSFVDTSARHRQTVHARGGDVRPARARTPRRRGTRTRPRTSPTPRHRPTTRCPPIRRPGSRAARRSARVRRTRCWRTTASASRPTWRSTT